MKILISQVDHMSFYALKEVKMTSIQGLQDGIKRFNMATTYVFGTILSIWIFLIFIGFSPLARGMIFIAVIIELLKISIFLLTITHHILGCRIFLESHPYIKRIVFRFFEVQKWLIKLTIEGIIKCYISKLY